MPRRRSLTGWRTGPICCCSTSSTGTRAIARGKEVLPRLPVIPGYNNSLEDAAGFVRLLGEAGADRVQLLPFHQFGENKYTLLSREYAYRDVPALHEEELASFRQVFLDAGIDAFF